MTIGGFIFIGFLITWAVYYFMRSIVVGVLVALLFVSAVHMVSSNTKQKDEERLEYRYDPQTLANEKAIHPEKFQ